jgi:HlyD family secretion protein
VLSFLKGMFSGRRWVAAVIAAAATGAILFFVYRREAAAEYTTRAVERGAIRSVVNATGTVQAFLTVQVGSQVSGQIEALHADYNSVVKRGQLLAKIDPRQYQAQLSGAEANLLSAQARVNSAQADLNSQLANQQSAKANVETARVARDNSARVLARYEELRAQGILSQNDYDNAKATAETNAAKYDQAMAQAQQVEAQTNSSRAQVEQAKAQVEQAEAALKQAQVNLEYTNIYSPVDGVVVSRSVDVGQTVAASLSAPTLFVIANDLAKMQVHASVDEADIGSISQEAEVTFTVDAYPNRNFRGQISEIRLEPQTVQNVVTYTVVIDVNNERLELKPGMTANIAVTVAEQPDVLKVPNTALRYLPPGTTREEVTRMLREEANGKREMTRAPGAEGASAVPEGAKRIARREALSARADDSRNDPVQRRELSSGDANLAPGQMWNPTEKIQFPSRNQQILRPAIVWALGAQKKPEARRVVLGITDGTFTQVVSGDLKEGDAAIVGDTAQGASPSAAGEGRPQGGGGRFFFGGPPR